MFVEALLVVWLWPADFSSVLSVTRYESVETCEYAKKALIETDFNNGKFNKIKLNPLYIKCIDVQK